MMRSVSASFVDSVERSSWIVLTTACGLLARKTESAYAKTFCGSGKTHPTRAGRKFEVSLNFSYLCFALIQLEIKSLRYDLPDPPVFGREPFKHTIKELAGGQGYDDLYNMNTQSGSQVSRRKH